LKVRPWCKHRKHGIDGCFVPADSEHWLAVSYWFMLQPLAWQGRSSWGYYIGG